MREIKFRGIKRSSFGDKWVSGYYALMDGEHVIIMPHGTSYEKALSENKPIPKVSVNHIVDFNTIGQYTGLKDKNGVEIYEGDILKLTNNGEIRIGKVIYEHTGFTIDVMNMDRPYGRVGFSMDERYIEIIGNIYDNPEFLEKED